MSATIARSLKPVDSLEVSVLVDGFHLSGAEVEAIIPDTIRDFGAFGLKRIVPCHCTGWRALHALAQIYGEDVLVPSAVGRQFIF